MIHDVIMQWFTYTCPICNDTFLLLKEPNEPLLPIESKCAKCLKKPKQST